MPPNLPKRGQETDSSGSYWNREYVVFIDNQRKYDEPGVKGPRGARSTIIVREMGPYVRAGLDFSVGVP